MAENARLFVIALDTPPDPANDDITFATDNFADQELIRQSTRSSARREDRRLPSSISLMTRSSSFNRSRDRGFLTSLSVWTPG